jgi:hypothetical protein
LKLAATSFWATAAPERASSLRYGDLTKIADSTHIIIPLLYLQANVIARTYPLLINFIATSRVEDVTFYRVCGLSALYRWLYGLYCVAIAVRFYSLFCISYHAFSCLSKISAPATFFECRRSIGWDRDHLGCIFCVSLFLMVNSWCIYFCYCTFLYLCITCMRSRINVFSFFLFLYKRH